MAVNVRALTKTVITMPTPTIDPATGRPVNWLPSVSTTTAGFLVIAMGPQGGSMTDVTYFRDAPARVDNYSFIDPFTYGSAVITFPQITIFDDLDALGFLGTEDNPANVDIYWYAAAAGAALIDPMTQQRTLTYGAGTKLWEGFIASREIVGDEESSYLQVQCQGALFQLDGYKQKPFYPRRPYVLERLMFEVMYPYYEPADPTTGGGGHPFAKPSLRTQPLTTRWPTGWTKKTPPRGPDEPNLYTPVIPPDRLWTGYTTRNTGTWENTLTGFIQDMLAVMYTTDDSGVTAGNQWALRCEENRAPVLEIRDRNRAPDFEFWVGTPGISINVTNDFTTKENSIYGEGTGTDGTLWRNSHFTGAWNRTDYDPLAAIEEVFPAIPDGEPGATGNYDPNVIVRESKTQFGSGMTMDAATKSSEKRLETVKEAGLVGTMTLKCDPSTMTRFQIRAGMTVKLKGLRGSGETGINFHIAEVVVNVANLTVECKIDTKYRDLLTLEEARARTIDPMTPSKLLQVNKRSLTIEDILAPWDYHAGAGYIPKTARHGKNKKAADPADRDAYDYFAGMPQTERFPWRDWVKAHPPSSYPKLPETGDDRYLRGPFVRCWANESATRNKWSFVPIITAQKVTIRKIELAAYDIDGNVLEIPFHISFYHEHVVEADMPHTTTSGADDYSPFTPGHFEEITLTGEPTDDTAPPGTFIIGWGNAEQRAGYSPRLFSEGASPTGMFEDDGDWNIDNTAYTVFDSEMTRGQTVEAITIWAAIWADYTEKVYFLGRMYKAEQAGA